MRNGPNGLFLDMGAHDNTIHKKHMIPTIHIKNIKDAKATKRETKPQINYLKMHTETRKLYKSTKPPVTKDTKHAAISKEEETVRGWKKRYEEIYKKNQSTAQWNVIAGQSEITTKP